MASWLLLSDIVRISVVRRPAFDDFADVEFVQSIGAA